MLEIAFTTPIYVESVHNIDNESLSLYCNQLKHTSVGRQYSNLGGWQSDNVVSDKKFYKLIAYVEDYTANYFSMLGYKKNLTYKVNDLWVNINGKNNSNHPHVHPGSSASGVYFVKCDPKLSGRIVFINPHAYNFNEDYINEYSPANSGKHFHYPVEGKLLIFQPWISHYVEPNLDINDRISISFNIGLQHDGKN